VTAPLILMIAGALPTLLGVSSIETRPADPGAHFKSL